jgi:Sulfotransferase domain
MKSRLPDFIAVGPQRTGTTWMHQVLSGHAGLPASKETDFFTKNFERGLDWYLGFFRDCPPDLPMGEIDPNYFGDELAADRIGTMIPHCRILVTLRDPVDRAWSSYRTMRRDAWTRASFEQTVHQNRVIRESSRYAHHLANWREHFGADRVLVMLYDDLELDPQAYLNRICAFVGVARIAADGATAASERVNTVTRAPRSRKLAQSARNARDWMLMHRWNGALRMLEALGVWRFAFGGGEVFGDIDPEIDARLREQFRPEVEALETMLGRDLSAWKRPRAKSSAAGTPAPAQPAAATDRA